MKVLPEVERVVRDFHTNKKPIGASGIAPIILAKLFGRNTLLDKILGRKPKITLGMKSGDEWFQSLI